MPDYGENNEKLPENLVSCLSDIIRNIETEDSWVRKQQVKLWKKNDEFWHGVQFIFWSEARQDWIAPTETRWFQQEEGREEAEGPFYDYVINIYKAHGESVIAALSAQIPAIRFPPDDADNEDDLTTSETFSKIADLIQKHNSAKLVLLRALFMLWNQGIVAAYHYTKTDKKYGMHEIPVYQDMEQETSPAQNTCPGCGHQEVATSTLAPSDANVEGEQGSTISPSGPQEGGNSFGSGVMPPSIPCPQCGQVMQHQERQTEVIPIIADYEKTPKSRTIIDVYGPLNVKVPYYSKDQDGCGYLMLSLDKHKGELKHWYPHVADKIEADYTEIGAYERVARTPSSYSSYSRIDENKHLSTLRRAWIRPWMFETLGDQMESEKRELQKLFPKGCYFCFIGKTFVEARNEDLDEHWTIGQAGLSSYIHSDPLGQPLIPIQEMRNVLVNLTLETIEHAIPSSYANPKVLDFTSFSRHESLPGMVYPATPLAGTSLSDHFYTEPRATVSKEIPIFGKQLDQDGQFSVGSFPSIYGGPAEGKSRTFSEYNASRQMALQRLSIAWTFLTFWWAKLMDRCVRMYVNNLVTDEKYVTRENDNYVNVWIRKAQLTGNVGEVEAEGSETFPVSLPQKRDLLLQLFQLNNEFINAAIFDTENRRIVADAVSFTDLKIPGEDQRVKQAREIQDMLKGQPVQIEPPVDDDEIHIATLKAFLVSSRGLDAKRTNPKGYQLCIMHLMQHQQDAAMKTQQQFAESPPGHAPEPGVE